MANKHKGRSRQPKTDKPKSKPIHIPLSFDAAVDGLLAVKPKKKPSSGSTPK